VLTLNLNKIPLLRNLESFKDIYSLNIYIFNLIIYKFCYKNIKNMEHRIYHPPVVDIRQVIMEHGIANVATSIQGKAVSWEDVDTPEGTTPEDEGGC
jgi:hypothetical protein